MVYGGTMMSSLLDSPDRRARTALAAYQWSPYIRQAERAIASRASTVPWWLEDAEGEHVTDESPDAYRAIHDSIEKPYRPAEGEPVNASPQTRAGLWSLTLRHMGLCGYAFHYLDQVEALGRTPLQTLIVNPTRMTPATNREGQLIGWVLDATSRGGGTPLTLAEVVMYELEPADEGFLPTGLVATALAKAQLARAGDHHAAYVLSSGGRQPGIYRPMSGNTIPEETYNSLVRDLSSVVERPDAAKRSLVLKGPVEFQDTSMAPQDMQMLDIMAMARDDIFALWGVPKSQVGYERPSGLGDSSEDKDYEALWNGAIWPRLGSFLETLQYRVLDRYAALGLPVTIKVDQPSFDDDAPKYDMASKAVSVPLRTVERRAILGLPPTGDPLIDDAIVLPVNMVGAYQAPPSDAGDTQGMAKARLEHDKRVEALTGALERFLKDQAKRIGAKVERNSGHIAAKPRETSAWWNEKEENEALLRAIRPYVTDMADDAIERALSQMNVRR